MFWFAGSRELPMRAREAVEAVDSTVFVSVVTPWELAIKHALGKLECGPLLDRFSDYLDEQGFFVLGIGIDDGIRAGALPSHHRDPFDRMLVSQAQAESLTVVSSDAIFEHYGVPRVW